MSLETTGRELALVHQRAGEQAEDAPERVAVRFEDQTLTYGALDARATQLARFLRAQGVGPEVAVGLCLERSLELPIGLWGILKAGGAYVPLDPEQPAERHRHILRDTGAALVLTEEKFHRQLQGTQARVVLLDADRDRIAQQAGHGPPAPADRSQLAYVIYTSGSTGRPKGVQIEHGALSQRWARSPYGLQLGPGDVLAAITAVSWNPSVYELLCTLAQGATIALASREVVRDPARLARFLSAHGVTFMRAVPSLWQALLDAGWTGTPGLKIHCHGEQLGKELADRLSGFGNGVWNTYGSTEASAFSQVDLTADGRRVLSPPRAGEAALVRVLGPDLRPAEPLVPGELHIGGPLLARGYLNDPELTARRFVADPSGAGRLYKTGDLGRYLPGGAIELLGRADRQVKLRGQRVELGEVEAAIARCAGVQEAVAVVREDTPGDQRLVAYLVLAAGALASAGQLRSWLKEKLPVYLLPASFVFLEAMPLTANGKVDRAALPAPGRARPDLTGPFAGPETEVEHALARIFAGLLGFDEVGLDDDFFALGGHSLLAARVAARVKGLFELDLSLAAFFEAGTVRALAAEIERRRAQGERSPRSAIVPVRERREAPLSPAQERLWFLHQLAPDGSAYSLPSALRLEGPVDARALQQSLHCILERHEALRTTFSVDADGRPRQSVQEAGEFDLPLVDLTHLPLGERVEAARAQLAQEARLPFSLRVAPLLRAKLYALGPSVHILFVNLHHIAGDGWSNAVLRRELGLAYNACSSGEAPRLPALPVQYLDYAQWQRGPVAQAELGRQLSYWRARLAGLEALALPADRPRPKAFTQRGAREALVVSSGLLESLKALARRHNASLYMVLLAAFKVLLFRYTGQEDLAVGSPVAGRNAAETEGLIGFFVNTVVLRSTVSAAATFEEVLRRVKAAALEAFANQDLPFERLVTELNPERDLASQPLVQTILAVQNTPYAEAAFSHLRSQPFAFRNDTTRFDTELHVWEREEGLLCHLIYSTDLFDAWRMQQLLRDFERVLGEVARDPRVQVGRLDLLSPAEREKIVVDWNRTDRAFPTGQCVHHLFEEQAARTPDALAVSGGGERLTYRELNGSANRLAEELIGKGVGPGSIVAVGLEASPALLVGVLAVLKAGGAYLPLDPSYPTERLNYLLNDSGASLLITRDELRERFRGAPVEVILAGSWDAGASGPAPDPPRRTGAGDLAYVIYTSGSTGRPNGVELQHRGLLNLALWHRETYALTPADRTTLVASPSFDASVWEMWPSLIAGASLHIPGPETRVFPKRLVDWLAAQAITLCFLPTPLLEACLGEEFAKVSSLRAVLTGGERLQRAPGPELPFALFNHYGPTEATVVSTAALVAPSAGAGTRPPSIGKPIANTRAYVLDNALNPVPVGVAGELHLGGVGLARGYLGRPALTAARFIANPFGAGRLYKTGDLARTLPDGNLEFLGRIDHQVKLRGFRIEPGEIDAALSQCAGVREAITIAREDTPGHQRLVSYLVAHQQGLQQDGALAEEYVAQWQALYQQAYGAEAASADGASDLAGWNSSFTGQPLPALEMREWVDSTVAAIARFRPERILELGCGTGLLLFPLAGTAKSYLATDLSRQAIEGIRRRLSSGPAVRAAVKLETRPAHDLSWLAGEAPFDTVILNSVVQYFPSAGYLLEVLAQAVDRVAPGGRVFVGDVRNQDLAEAFHLAVELFKSAGRAGEVESTALRRRAQANLLKDKELLLSPALFHGLRSRLPRISAVEVRPKRGRAQNEMTLFRYDVTLHVETAVRRVAATVLEWGEEVADLPALEDLLRDRRGAAVLVKGMVDHRGAPSLHSGGAVDLEALHTLAGRTNHRADVRLASGSRSVEVLFTGDDEPVQPLTAEGFTSGAEPPPGLGLSSDPLRLLRAGRLLPAIRAQLGERLPEHMIPAAFVFLDALPLTPNGKVDRRRLPAPGGSGERPDLPGSSLPPRTSAQQALARIFAEVLGLDRVGLEDNFFELGGHSLLAVQVVSRLQDRLGVELPLAALFEAPTAAALAQRVEERKAAARPHGIVSLADEDVAALPLTPMDVTFHYGRVFFKAARHLWYQVLELETPPLDLERLRAAILYAVNRHPIARGRLSSSTALGRSVHWEVAARLTAAPLAIEEAGDDAGLERLKERVVNTPFPLDEAPSFRFALIRGGTKDLLLVRHNHGAVDASGLQCLLNSLMSRYLGEPDPGERVTPFATQELLRYHQPGAAAARSPVARLLENNELAHLAGLLPAFLPFQRPRWLQTSLWRPSEIFPAPIRGLGGDRERSRDCEAAEAPFTLEETRRLGEAARRAATTVDRLFLAGFLLGASNWNLSVAGDTGRVETYWAVNLRPPRYFNSVVANQFAWSRVRAPGRSDPEGWLQVMLDPAADFLLRGALDWSRSIEAFHSLRLPDVLRRLAMKASQRSIPSMVISDTLSFNELGQGDFSGAFGVRRAKLHSRFSFGDRPLIVISQRDERFRLRMIYPRSLFDPPGADQFLEACKQAILELAVSIPARAARAAADAGR